MKELQEKGQIYDFRNDTDMAEEIAVELESMNPKELNRLKTEMHRVLAESRKEQEKESVNWFNQAVVPVLKDFVEQSEACLDLSEDGDLEVTAMTRTRDVDHIKIIPFDHAVAVRPDKVLSRNGPPVTYDLLFDMFHSKRRTHQRVIQQI